MGEGGGAQSVAASFEEWRRERRREKEGRRREKEEKKRAKEERRASQSQGGGEVKAEEGEVVVPEGGDEDGEGDEDEEWDEVHVQPPPPQPLFYPFPSGCKRPSEKTQRSAARQPLPPGLPKSLNRAVGHTSQFFLTPARVTTPFAGLCADFSGA